MASIIHLRMKNRALFPLCVCSIYDSKEQFYWSGVSLGESTSLTVKEQLNLYQHYRAKHRREAFEKYICHLSNYLNAPRRMQMNWLLQAANFNDCRSHPIAWLSLSGMADWNINTQLCWQRSQGQSEQKGGASFPGHIIVTERTAQCRFVVWRKSAVELLPSEPQKPVGIY